MKPKKALNKNPSKPTKEDDTLFCKQIQRNEVCPKCGQPVIIPDTGVKCTNCDWKK